MGLLECLISGFVWNFIFLFVMFLCLMEYKVLKWKKNILILKKCRINKIKWIKIVVCELKNLYIYVYVKFIKKIW